MTLSGQFFTLMSLDRKLTLDRLIDLRSRTKPTLPANQLDWLRRYAEQFTDTLDEETFRRVTDDLEKELSGKLLCRPCPP